MNYFNSLEFIEPKCPECGIILDYGTNTEFNDREMAHVCTSCNHVLK